VQPISRTLSNLNLHLEHEPQPSTSTNADLNVRASDNSDRPSQNAAVLPKYFLVNGKRFNVGALLGRLSAQQVRYLAGIASPAKETIIKVNENGELLYQAQLQHPEGHMEALSIILSTDKKNNLNSISIENQTDDGQSFTVKLDNEHSAKGLLGATAQLNNVLKDGLRHITSADSLRRANSRDSLRHIKRTAENVKTSKSSPTGYKLPNGQPCDRHGVPVDQGATSSKASSSSAVADHGSANMSNLEKFHLEQGVAQRAQSPYAALLRQALRADESEASSSAHAALYRGGALSAQRAASIIKKVIASLDPANLDEYRLAEYLQHLQKNDASRSISALPDYYRCTTEDRFEAILSTEAPKVPITTARSNTGATGAWLSSIPEVKTYGPFILGFNHNLDLIHSTRSASGKTPVRTVDGNLHIGIQEPISLSDRTPHIGVDPSLSVIGVPKELLEEYKIMSARLGMHMVFIRADGSRDIAIFNTETIQKMASLLRDQAPARCPKFW